MLLDADVLIWVGASRFSESRNGDCRRPSPGPVIRGRRLARGLIPAPPNRAPHTGFVFSRLAVGRQSFCAISAVACRVSFPAFPPRYPFHPFSSLRSLFLISLRPNVR